MLSEQGFTDPEIRDAVEWSYERAMKGQEERVPLGEWIASIKENPENAPAVLRPHLTARATPEITEASTPAATAIEAAPVEDTPLLPPRTNTAAKPAPVQSGNILDRIGDLDFYEQNREAIRDAYFKSKR